MTDHLTQSAKRVKRKMRLFWAHVRCDAYLLFSGMWRGECKMICMDGQRRIEKIVAAKGVFPGFTETKVFFDELP